MRIKPVKRLFGEITVPGDKSISHRAVMIGAIAKGETRIKNLLDCDDCNNTIGAFREMGVVIREDGDDTIIKGRGLKGLKKPKCSLNAGESGTTMRLLAGILAGQDFQATLEGNKSLSQRPMNRIIEPLTMMGVDIKAARDGRPPLVIKGGNVKPVTYNTPVSSAQVKSAILLAGLYPNGTTTVEERLKSRDHTERMLKFFGADIKVDKNKVSVTGAKELNGKAIEVPGDISSASFFMIGASIIKNSKVKIVDVGINPTRAGILEIMSNMGARVKINNTKDLFEPSADIEIESGLTHGVTIEKEIIPNIIDELPVIFVLAAFSEGETIIRGAGELKVKETDRINSMKYNLEKMGAEFEVKGDSIMIHGARQLKGAAFKSFGDHRTCMAMTIASLAAKGDSEIDDTECVSKSFPEFFETLKRCQAPLSKKF